MGAPQESIPRSSGRWPTAKEVYRFYSNKKVNPQIIDERERLKAIERGKAEPIFLARGDATILDLCSHPEAKGFGP